MHILIAPNAFKNSLSAPAAAEAIGRGLRQSRLTCSCESFPVGDGGDGTAALLIQRLGGDVVTFEVCDPLGRKIMAPLGMIPGSMTAVIELGDASGLRLLRPEEFDPLRATTAGTGGLIRHALDLGARHILLAVGGSATVDGGAGILQALGLRFRKTGGNILTDIPTDLAEVESIDLTGLDERIARCKLTLLCDVENPLLGEHGAAPVFGPQKGASESMIRRLDLALTRFCVAIRRATGRDVAGLKRGGAAGGVAAGLHGVLNADLADGIDYFLEVSRFDDALAKADLVITGEGRMDEQTLRGKGPIGVALRARKKKIPVIALAGVVVPEAIPALQRHFDQLRSISDPSLESKTALAKTASNLERAATALGNELATSNL